MKKTLTLILSLIVASLSFAATPNTQTTTNINASRITATKGVFGSISSASFKGNTISPHQITAGMFSNTITPVEIFSQLPTTGNFIGRIVALTTDSKLYRWNGTTWTAAVASSDIAGQILNAQIASLAASKITGQLTDAQLAAIASAKLTGQITTTQISDGAISTPKLAAGSVTSNEIAANTITAADIATGTITATQIASGSITSAQIAAGTIQANNIAASTITGDKIAANTITADDIAANTITTAQLATGTLSASNITTGTLAASQSISVGGVSIDAGNGSTTGNIRAGKTTPTDTTSGFWLGNSSGVPKFSIGDTNSHLIWDGTSLNYTGNYAGQYIIRGVVAANGTILFGSGFTVNKTGTGAYTINFNNRFVNTDIPFFTVETMGITTKAGINITDGTQALIQIQYIATATLTDSNFSFLVMGTAQ